MKRRTPHLQDLDLPVVPAYQPRFLTAAQVAEGVELYHLARTALAGSWSAPTRHTRLQWAARELHKKYPAVALLCAYKDLDGALA